MCLDIYSILYVITCMWKDVVDSMFAARRPYRTNDISLALP